MLETSPIPQYKKYMGKRCVDCGKIIVVTIKYDKKNEGDVTEFSYIKFQCDCGALLAYRNGAWSYISKKDFDKNKSLLDDLGQSNIEVKTSGFRCNPLPSV